MKTAVSAALVLLLVTMLVTGAASAAGNVAKIKETGTEYSTVSAAFTAATSGQTIELLQDSMDDEITVSTMVTLDLKGKILRPEYTSYGIFIINSGGNLTLIDSSGGGKLTVGKTNLYGYVPNGGVAYINSGGSFTMNSGNITGCHASSSGGAVYINGGTFTMNGGNITDCISDYRGGGVSVQLGGSSFIMNGGNITGCTATEYGGGVFFVGGTFTMTGGAISGCTATESGGGVAAFNSPFTMSGTALVAENNDVYLRSYSSNFEKLKCGGAFASSAYGAKNITLNGGPTGWVGKTIVENGASSASNFKLSTLPAYSGYRLAVSGSNLILSDGIEVSTWAELVAAVSGYSSDTMRTISVAGDITSTEDANFDGIPVTGNITLKPSSGTGEFKIDAAQKGRLFKVQSSGKLTLKGNGDAVLNLTGGKMSSGNGGAVYVNGGSFTMSNCNITDCTANNGGAVYISDGTFTMSGSNIANCTASTDGGGVYLYKYLLSSTFTMAESSITNCAAKHGGGVFVNYLSRVNMYDSSISDCTASEFGGGVYTNSYNSIFNISGTASVTGNTVTGTGNNVYLNSNESLHLAGPFTGSVGIKWAGAAPAEGTQFGVVDSGGSGAEHFFADDDSSLVGDISGSSLVWKAKPAPTPTPTPTPTPVAPSSEYHNLGAGIWCTYDEERNVYTLLPEAAIPSSAYSSNPFSAAADGPLASPSISIGSLPASAYNVTFLGWRNEDVKIIEVQPGINLTGGSGAFAAFTNAELSYFGDGTEPARDVFGAGRLIYPVNATNSSEILPNGHYTGRAMTLETDWAVAGQKVKIAVIPENGYAVYDWKLHKGEYKTGDLITPVENYIERINDPDYGSTTYVLTMPNSAVTVEPVLRDQGSTIVVYLFIDADSYVLEIPADFNIKKQDLPVTDKMVNLTACDMLPGHVLNVNMTSEGGYTNLGISGVGSTFVMSNIRSSADKAGYTIAKKQIYKGETGFTQITNNGDIVLSTEGFDAESLEDKLMEGNMKTELEFTLKGVTNQNTLGKYKDKLTFTVEIES